MPFALLYKEERLHGNLSNLTGTLFLFIFICLVFGLKLFHLLRFTNELREQTNKKVSASLLNHVITICTGFHSTEKLKEVEEFFASRTTKEMERTVKNRLEAIKTNINTLDKQTDSTVAYFKQNYAS